VKSFASDAKMARHRHLRLEKNETCNVSAAENACWASAEYLPGRNTSDPAIPLLFNPIVIYQSGCSTAIDHEAELTII
jgi:hypothetical protein